MTGFRRSFVHIAFAIAFFVFVGLCETLRHGLFGLTPYETTGIIFGTLAVLALLILRGDVVFLLRSPRNELYGNPDLGWSWRRSLLGLMFVPLLWLVPAIYGAALIQINWQPISSDELVGLLAFHVFFIAFAQEAFFREAAVKAFGADVSAMFVVAGLCSFIFHMPEGMPAAMIAGGAGLFYMALRLIGTNIIVVSVGHGVTSIVFTSVLSLGLTGQDAWIYAATFLTASVVLAVSIYSVFTSNRRRFEYA